MVVQNKPLETPKVLYLKDYQSPDFFIQKTDLTFDIQSDVTYVTSVLSMKLNPMKKYQEIPPLVLQGKNIQLISLEINGVALTEDDYEVTPEQLTCAIQKKEILIKIVTTCDPKNNTALEGLYQSNEMYCTQCEAEGFRRITYYLDRPDVMSVFTVKIIANKKKYPVLLSNGNKIEEKILDDERHFAVWHDPFPKPCYLFALVAGNLQSISDTFITMSGRHVTLEIFTEPHNIHKCDYALDALKRSMKWDEERYHREYDLDIFMIVAVDSFNMGAMENKGLNIFNSNCILANAKTAVDSTFQRIESVVGHEYFHNWSGNRVTCRDWFQLSLKEGFTVFREQEFAADMNSRVVQRIADVHFLRSVQFLEDNSALSHPVRPESFIEISNFYTATIYNKGAEVIRMLMFIIGKENFYKGCDLYFQRHDGQAVTCDDFIKAMEDVSQISLEQFMLWYSQAGTPKLDITDEYDEKNSKYSMTIEQTCISGAQNDQEVSKNHMKPFHIPIMIGLLGQQGQSLSWDDNKKQEDVLHLKKKKETFTFSNVSEKPIPSLLREFSAPVKMNYAYSKQDLITLASHDTDEFNRWEYGQRLITEEMERLALCVQEKKSLVLDRQIIDFFKNILEHAHHDHAMSDKMMILPTPLLIGERMDLIDVEALCTVELFFKQELAKTLYDAFDHLYDELTSTQAKYQVNAEEIARRSLKNRCLYYMIWHNIEDAVIKAKKQNDHADNMTDKIAAMRCLLDAVAPSAQELAVKEMSKFATKWENDSNVMDIWFSLYAGCEKKSLSFIEELMQHPCFDIKNPNKVRSVLGSFCSKNLKQFHQKSGAGYLFLADQVLNIDKLNPLMAARLITPLTRWRRYILSHQEGMKCALKKIHDCKDLSPDTFEIVAKSLPGDHQ